MKVSELIEALQELPPHLEVYSYCYHGQTPEKSGNPTVVYAKDVYSGELEYALFDGFTSCPIEGEDEGFIPFVLL